MSVKTGEDHIMPPSTVGSATAADFLDQLAERLFGTGCQNKMGAGLCCRARCGETDPGSGAGGDDDLLI